MLWAAGLILFLIFGVIDIAYPMGILQKWFYPLLLSCFLVLYRIFRGKTVADCAVAIDILGILVIGFCGIFAFVSKHDIYLDIAIAWALQAFIGTLAIGKYLEGRTLDD